jgi:hypothetical protein
MEAELLWPWIIQARLPCRRASARAGHAPVTMPFQSSVADDEVDARLEAEDQRTSEETARELNGLIKKRCTGNGSARPASVAFHPPPQENGSGPCLEPSGSDAFSSASTSRKSQRDLLSASSLRVNSLFRRRRRSSESICDAEHALCRTLLVERLSVSTVSKPAAR